LFSKLSISDMEISFVLKVIKGARLNFEF
jgi:hypothetical protein